VIPATGEDGGDGTCECNASCVNEFSSIHFIVLISLVCDVDDHEVSIPKVSNSFSYEWRSTAILGSISAP
jgi:hypothetical protein